MTTNINNSRKMEYQDRTENVIMELKTVLSNRPSDDNRVHVTQTLAGSMEDTNDATCTTVAITPASNDATTPA